jgi:PmbA protein
MKIDHLQHIGGFGLRLIDLAISRGADQAEVFIKSSRNLSLEVKNQTIDAIESSLGFGYSVRIIKDSGLGFSYSTSISEAESVVDNALEAARWADKDEYLDLPGKNKDLKFISGIEIYDKEITELRDDEAIKYVISIEKAAKGFDSRIKKTRKASGTFKNGEIMILNSKGVDILYPYTICIAQITTVAEENGESQMGWDYDGNRFLKDISFEDIGRNAARRAVQLLGSKKISTTKTPVVFDSSVTSEFLGILASSLSAESVQKGRSLLRDKIGKRVISEKINLIDSGIIPKKLGTKPFDDEGVRTSENILIEKGVLRGYLYNSYTAKKDNVNSTGNAVREGYNSIPSVGITNLYLKAVSNLDIVPFDRLLSALDRGLYITEAMGAHTANPISGEFSIGVSGLWIENGIARFPVKEAVVSGDILSLFHGIEAIGDDMRFYGNIGTPSLLIGPIDISG